MLSLLKCIRKLKQKMCTSLAETFSSGILKNEKAADYQEITLERKSLDGTQTFNGFLTFRICQIYYTFTLNF